MMQVSIKADKSMEIVWWLKLFSLTENAGTDTECSLYSQTNTTEWIRWVSGKYLFKQVLWETLKEIQLQTMWRSKDIHNGDN